MQCLIEISIVDWANIPFDARSISSNLQQSLTKFQLSDLHTADTHFAIVQFKCWYMVLNTINLVYFLFDFRSVNTNCVVTISQLQETLVSASRSTLTWASNTIRPSAFTVWTSTLSSDDPVSPWWCSSCTSNHITMRTLIRRQSRSNHALTLSLVAHIEP